MLVVSRKVDQVIQIGQNIEIMVTAIERGQVKIGIKAPHDLKITRKDKPNAIGKEAG